jgi:type IV pilus assembly protein PilP
MKKIKSVFFNTIIIIFVAANFAFAGGLKNILSSFHPSSANVTSTAAKTPAQPVSAAKKASAQNPAQPVSAATKAPVQNPAQPVSAATKVPAPAANAPVTAPTLAPADVYNYNPAGKPDPFRPFIVVEKVEKKPKVERKAPLSIFPLQRAETERYRVVGIAGDKDHMVAIAEDTAKKFYPLFKGTRIGLNDGKVIEILADRVIVEEYENKKAKRIILKLRKN